MRVIFLRFEGRRKKSFTSPLSQLALLPPQQLLPQQASNKMYTRAF